MIQLAVVKIADYGPWTLTRGSDREHELQMLQASLYGRLQGLFSEMDCLVFPNRWDEMYAVSNGLDMGGHRGILGRLDVDSVGITMSVGAGETPLAADRDAHRARREGERFYTSSDDGPPAADGAVPSEIYGRGGGGDEVMIMHMDVDNLGGRRKDSSPYEIAVMIAGLHRDMSEFFLKHESLSFFMGGDNFMVLASDSARQAAPAFLKDMADSGMRLNCGIGRAGTGRQAARLATESLDEIRRIRDSGRPNPGIYEVR